ncbi:hypothetical protein T4C_6142 [Trichinella pseudospiralis]|uniref:Ubiquitin-like protease family profile domain-containing protein n=1 Tax=Trichinella pseudospiralis TaxID=6337 RepID=A0A0V1JHG5_TRIPS|nr:hypothetical protein T4C_6142 [Trichinella pseudospiralis]
MLGLPCRSCHHMMSQYELLVSLSLLSLLELSGKHIDCIWWRDDIHDGVPMQTIALNCGLFACLFLKYLLHTFEHDFVMEIAIQ